MTGLSAQQAQMQGLVVMGGDSAGFLRDRGVPVATRLLIYQNAYRGRLIEALKLNYPVLRLVMGDEAFDVMALRFVDEHPSRRRSIRWFGEYLETFLRAAPDCLAHPALFDLARLEWALCLAFDAADTPVLAADALGHISADAWSELVFRLHPSVHLLELDWEIEPTLQALIDDETSETEAPVYSPHGSVVWRMGLGPRWRVLSIAELECLRAIEAGRNFAALCELSASHTDARSAASNIAQLLQGWVAGGLLAAI